MTLTPGQSTGDTLYAFNKTDTKLILALLNGAGTQKRGQRREQKREILCGKTDVSGIGADDTGTVYYRQPTTTGWEDTYIEYTVWNIHPTASVAPETIVLFCQVNGEWVVIYEAC